MTSKKERQQSVKETKGLTDLDTQATVVGGTTFKIPMNSFSSQSFKSVPRSWHVRFHDK